MKTKTKTNRTQKQFENHPEKFKDLKENKQNLLRFRLCPIAFKADITKAFLETSIADKDRRYLEVHVAHQDP